MNTILQCSRGHAKTPDNTFGKNQCKPCHKLAVARYEKTPRAKAYRKKQAAEPITRLYRSEWYTKNRDKMRARHLMRRYNLSIADYEMLIASQNGRCAICNILGSETSKGLVVDHLKGTKQVRGLLCNVCNSHVVHVVEDYADRIPKAIVYLSGAKKRICP